MAKIADQTWELNGYMCTKVYKIYCGKCSTCLPKGLDKQGKPRSDSFSRRHCMARALICIPSLCVSQRMLYWKCAFAQARLSFCRSHVISIKIWIIRYLADVRSERATASTKPRTACNWHLSFLKDIMKYLAKRPWPIHFHRTKLDIRLRQ